VVVQVQVLVQESPDIARTLCDIFWRYVWKLKKNTGNTVAEANMFNTEHKL